MNRKIIFIGGVNGVGKTTLSKELAPAIAFTHLTASSLIRQGLSPLASRHIENKKDLDRRQQILLKQLAAHPAPAVILDGHYSVVSPRREFYPMELSVFEQVKPSLLVLLRDDPQAIFNRLMARDGSAPSVTAINDHQICEREQARVVAQALHVPLVTLHASDKVVDKVRLVAGLYGVL